MKKPIIDQWDRWITLEYPSSVTASVVRQTIATARLKRELGRIFKKLCRLAAFHLH